jgi:hypothetical protein
MKDINTIYILTYIHTVVQIMIFLCFWRGTLLLAIFINTGGMCFWVCRCPFLVAKCQIDCYQNSSIIKHTYNKSMHKFLSLIYRQWHKYWSILSYFMLNQVTLCTVNIMYVIFNLRFAWIIILPIIKTFKTKLQ